jgi:hypothetical protein
MEQLPFNPLSRYFRQPVIYLKLPSDGKWWSPESLDIPENRELPIYPMTARDEIILKTPDALMNGQGMVDVIQSCIPNIKNAWSCPSVDLDAILIAIRLATYGNNMDFESKCTNCGTKNLHGINLNESLASIKCPDFSNHARYKDLKIQLKPQNYKQISGAGQITYEEQRINSTLIDQNLPNAEKNSILTESIKRLIDLGIQACSNSTEYIEVNGQQVTNREFIDQFYKNAEAEVIKSLQTKIKEIAERNVMPPFSLKCENCHTVYEAELNFDYSSFFAQGF